MDALFLPVLPLRLSQSRPKLSFPASTSCLSSSASRGSKALQGGKRVGSLVSMATTQSSADITSEGKPGMPPANVGKNDLLIVGPGVLGRIVAEQWKKMHPDCQTFGQTLTTNHHAELTELGVVPLLKGSQFKNFPYVVFCAPPYGNADYPGEIRSAASSWSGEGSFVFTSSSVVYDCNDNGICDEESAIVPLGRGPRTDVILKAEKEVLDSGGCVVRLAGLYKSDRGAHAYWSEKGTVESRPDHIVNLIHYEDAAALCIAVLKQQLRSQIFLGCDNYPISRQEIMDCVDRSGKFSKKFQGFTGTSDPLGKRLNNSKTRAAIGWKPKYPSFPRFLGLQE